jgi:hypothetical protein
MQIGISQTVDLEKTRRNTTPFAGAVTENISPLGSRISPPEPMAKKARRFPGFAIGSRPRGIDVAERLGQVFWLSDPPPFAPSHP